MHVRGYLTGSTLTLSEETGLVRGYDLAIVMNLAMQLASSYGVTHTQLSAVTVGQARTTKDEIRKLNVQRIGDVTFDPALTERTIPAISTGRYGGYGGI